MRKLYVLQGMQGSFKSTFIRENNLTPFAVSLDTIREVFIGMTYDREGYALGFEREADFIYTKFKEALTKKLQIQNSIIVIDNMNISRDDINSMKEYADMYNYDLTVVQFPLASLEEHIKRNEGRELHKKISVKALTICHERYKNYIPVEDVRHITVEDAKVEIKNTVFANIESLKIDLNKYKKIHVFGDLQGCYQNLKEYLHNNGGLKDDEFYIFVGDLVDRGIENSKTVNFALKNYKRENVIFIKGNHEVHLENYANDRLVFSKEFNDETKIQLQNIDKKEIKDFCITLKDFFIYTYKDKNFFVSHAGLSVLPEYPNYVAGMGYYYNDGTYHIDIDKEFTEKNKDNNWYQIHGHRNVSFYTKIANLKSFSLEAKIEFGGFLPVLITDDNGITIKHYKNNIYKQREEKVVDINTPSDYEIIELMKNHELIKVKQSETVPYIASFNFTKEAFWDKKFEDELVAKARGLFVDLEDYKIIVRGYDKFFNNNEKGIATASDQYVLENYKGPIVGYVKENGFLGLAGYDRKQDELLFCSKSSFDTDFARYFKEITEKQLSSEQIESLKMLLNKENASAAFEVIDPVRDPHIVEYKEAKVILLDIIYNEFTFRKMPYEDLKKVAADIGIEIKQKKLHVSEPQKMLYFINAKEKADPILTKDISEGIVFEDAEGRMIKQKYPYYNFWKDLRGQVSRMAKSKIAVTELNERLASLEKQIDNKQEHKTTSKKTLLIEEIKRKTYDIEKSISKRQFINNIPAAIDFMNFLDNIAPEVLLSTDIIKLRNDAMKAGIFDKYIIANKELHQSKLKK